MRPYNSPYRARTAIRRISTASITLNSVPNLTGSVTIACWVKLDKALAANGSSVYQTIFCANNTHGMIVRWLDNAIYLERYGIASVVNSGGFDGLFTKQWTHVAVTKTATGDCRIYINGVMKMYRNVGTWNTDTSTQYFITGEGTAQLLQGNLAEFIIWDREFTPEEVIRLYADGPNIHNKNKLLEYSTFDRIGNTLLDDQGKINATISGTVSVVPGISPNRCNARKLLQSWEANGTTNEATIPSTPVATLFNTKTELTFASWFRFENTTPANGSKLISLKNGTNNFFTAELSVAAGLVYPQVTTRGASGDSVLTLTSPSNIPKGRWVHFAATVNLISGKRCIYINGICAANDNISALADSFTVPSSVAKIASDSAASFITGRLSELILEAREFSSTDIYLLYLNGPNERALPPIFYKLEEIAGATLFVNEGSLKVQADATVTGTHVSSSNVPVKLRPSFVDRITSIRTYQTSSLLNIPANSAIQVGTGDFTVDFWVFNRGFANRGSTQNVLFAFTNITNWGIFIASGDLLNTAATATTIILPKNVWTKLTVTRVGTLVTFYLNGQFAGTSTNAAHANSVGTGAMTFMTDAGANTRYVDGYSFGYRFFRRALSASEIYDLYAGHDDFIDNQDFLDILANEGFGSQASDLSGNAAHMALTGIDWSWRVPAVRAMRSPDDYGICYFPLGIDSFIPLLAKTCQGLSKMSLSGWFRLIPQIGSFDALAIILRVGSNLNGVNYFYIQRASASKVLTFYMQTGANTERVINSVAIPEVGAMQWIHFATSVDLVAQTQTMWINGKKVMAITGAAYLATTFNMPDETSFFASNAGSLFYTGLMDNMQIYEGTFTDSEVLDLFLRNSAPTEKDIIMDQGFEDRDVIADRWIEDGPKKLNCVAGGTSPMIYTMPR